MTPDFDLTRVRSDFPALDQGCDQGCAYVDAPGGSQVPRQVADATAATMVSGISDRGTLMPSQRREWCAPGHPDLPRSAHCWSRVNRAALR